MKAAVFSDTHGNIAAACRAVRSCRPDVILHLGDYERDADAIRAQFPDIPLYGVCGNCDMRAKSPAALTVELGPVRAFLTHGHLYDVKWSGPDRVIWAAMEAGAKLALYGHTHIPDQVTAGGITALNPGSAGTGRNPTWALVEIFDNGGFACEIREFAPAEGGK